MRIDRWNGNTLRRYHHASGAILCSARNEHHATKRASIIPASCRHVAVAIDRNEAARILREWRSLT